MKTTIFLDESGKPEIYSAHGKNLVLANQATKYLVFASVRTIDQLALLQKVMDFKTQLLKDPKLTSYYTPSYSLDSFHAKNDFHDIRIKFYDFINTLDVKIDVLVVEKMKCNPFLQQNPNKLYGIMAGQVLKNLMHQNNETEVIFSRKDSKLKLCTELQTEVERIRLEYLNKHPNLSKNTINISYYHNPHYTHPGLQIADYVAYAVFQEFEKQNSKYLKLVQNKIGRIHDICENKNFTQSNPLQLST